MARAGGHRNHDRIKAVFGVAAFHALLGYGLIAGLGFEVPEQVKDTFKVFDVPQEPPPPPIEEPPPPQPKAKEPEGEASPPNIKSKPAPVVVPPPKIRIKVPPKVATSDRTSPAVGNDRTAGNSKVAGPGTGSGGSGTGTGGGGSGTGSGGGLGAARAQRERGGIRDADYPKAAVRERASGTVFVRISVRADGRVSGCTVTRSSGNQALDQTTCTLIRSRFHYRPARNAQGLPIPSVEDTNFTWTWLPRYGT